VGTERLTREVNDGFMGAETAIRAGAALLVVVLLTVVIIGVRRRRAAAALSRDEKLRRARRATGQMARDRKRTGRGSLRGQGGGGLVQDLTMGENTGGSGGGSD